jgi:anti-sigma B factor antagonist
MALEIQHREREGIAVIDLTGRITAGAEVGLFRTAFEKIVASPPRLVINMKGVDYVDSTGLGALVMCSTRLTKLDGAARLVHVNRRNIELLVMTKIDTIFEVFDDEVDAINSFFPGRALKRFDILSFVRQLEKEEE